MSAHIDDQERVDLIKRWWKKYGTISLTLIALAMLAIGGWQYWQNRQLVHAENASILYQNMMYEALGGHSEEATKLANQLIGNYSNSVYALLAALYAAKDAVVHKDLATAKTMLNWSIKQAQKKSSFALIGEIARIRLATILISEDKAKEAVTVLDQVKDLNVLKKVALGDAFSQMKDYANAKSAYETAIAQLSPNDPSLAMIKIKLYQLPAQN